MDIRSIHTLQLLMQNKIAKNNYIIEHIIKIKRLNNPGRKQDFHYEGAHFKT